MDVAEQLYLALVHASAQLRRLDTELGLSPARFSVLAALRYHGPSRVGELARGEGVSQPTMTQSLQGLEADGLVLRKPDPHDGRGCVVELTPKGRALVRRARARKIAWVDDALGDLGDAPRRALQRAAERLDRASGGGRGDAG